ncbi:membrane protein of unknown function [Hyphomicrobium sp. 1Nfss2.1]
MDDLLRYLPGPQPVAVRYGATALLVLLAYGLRLALGSFSGAYGFLFFILPIIASALMFDRGTGFFAVGLSGLLVAILLDWDVKPGAHVGALLLFAIVGACLTFIAEGLHQALEKAHASQRATALLLDEMSHRVKNKFAMVRRSSDSRPADRHPKRGARLKTSQAGSASLRQCIAISNCHDTTVRSTWQSMCRACVTR